MADELTPDQTTIPGSDPAEDQTHRNDAAADGDIDAGNDLPTLERDVEAEEFDGDSALGSDADTTTASLAESMYNYPEYFGRTYHAYKEGKYHFPNDEKELDRLDLQHHMFAMTFGDNRLHFAPLQNPKKVLDIGFGTGFWCIDMADTYPDCQVIGIDLNAVQPKYIPINCKFFVDDADDEWIFPEGPFDYIHLRIMAGCFTDTRDIIRQAWNHLKPGGWIEFQDYGLPLKAMDDSLEGTNLKQWGELLCEAARKSGKPMGSEVSDNLKSWLQDGGFVDVGELHFMWPINTWPKDQILKELGRWNQLNISQGMEGFCLALLTKHLGWSKEEVDILVAKCTSELHNRRIHAYFPMPVVWGRKPFMEERIRSFRPSWMDRIRLRRGPVRRS